MSDARRSRRFVLPVATFLLAYGLSVLFRTVLGIELDAWLESVTAWLTDFAIWIVSFLLSRAIILGIGRLTTRQNQ